MKNTTLLCALTLLTAVAASGCGSSGMQAIVGDASSDIGTTAPVSPTTTGDDTITPTETAGDTTATDTGNTGTTDPDPTDNGTGLPVCDATHPPPCMIVDPGPGGGVKPGLLDHLPVDVVVTVDPTPTPPDTGGAGGGGSMDDHDGVGCHFQGPTGGSTGGRRMKQTVGTHDEAGDILSRNDCIML